jgi:putative transposase
MNSDIWLVRLGDKEMPWNPNKPYHPPHYYADSRIYFITARTFDRQPVWRNDHAKRIFVAELRDVVREYAVPLYAWAIMHEHCHALVYIEQEAQLVSFIKRLHGSSAIRINKQDDASGQKVWYNYWDYCPRDDRDFYRAFNYIHVQPIKHGILPAIGVLERESADVYTFSSQDVPELHELLGQYEFTSYLRTPVRAGCDG